MKTKPDLSFWKLWNLSFGFFGVQIAYALQSANVSRIFATIGADPHDLSYFWILPPLMGLLVQPVVGTLSDKTWTRFGRRLPYLIAGALVAVIVMCLLPNAGSFGLGISSAIIMGLVALMLLDTSINMAMQPFKMLVGDMVNEKQKGLAYSIQSFLCNAGSVVGFVFPFLLAWIGIQATAPDGVVPQTVIWSFYIGAAILMLCVLYSLVKIKEWPPKVYAEYNGGSTEENSPKEKTNMVKLLRNAPSTFWTVGLVQFFCWFAFLFMWTYTTGTVATIAFDTPVTDRISAITNGETTITGKYILINDTVTVVKEGKATVKGVTVNGQTTTCSLIVKNGNDTIVSDGNIIYDKETSMSKADFSVPFAKAGDRLSIDGTETILSSDAVLADHGYVREGEYYKVERSNRDTIVFFCHFGLECVLLSRLMNVSPMVLWHHTCAAPASVTTVVTEERREGKASFRMGAFGDISHFYAAGEEPSFSARFCETFDSADERHD